MARFRGVSWRSLARAGLVIEVSKMALHRAPRERMCPDWPGWRRPPNGLRREAEEGRLMSRNPAGHGLEMLAQQAARGAAAGS